MIYPELPIGSGSAVFLQPLQITLGVGPVKDILSTVRMSLLKPKPGALVIKDLG
jgi:hypothetical protein